jgi:hypothetical protein
MAHKNDDPESAARRLDKAIADYEMTHLSTHLYLGCVYPVAFEQRREYEETEAKGDSESPSPTLKAAIRILQETKLLQTAERYDYEDLMKTTAELVHDQQGTAAAKGM